MASPDIAPDWATLGNALAGSKLKETAAGLPKDKLKIPGLDNGDEAGTGDAAGDVGDALRKGLKSLF